MDEDLTFVKTELRKLSRAELREVASQVDGVSYSWLEKVRLGSYASEPLYSRVKRVADHLRTRTPAEAAQ